MIFDPLVIVNTKSNIPVIRYFEPHLLQPECWFLDILDGSAGEFEDTEEVYEAVGEVLQGISEKSEKDIRFDFFNFL